MAIPNVLSPTLVSGLEGEFSHTGPRSVFPAVLDSTAETSNVFGNVFTYKSEANRTVEAGGTGEVAGIMISPKEGAIDHDYARNGTAQSFARQGIVDVDVGTSASTIGDLVYFVNATGALGVGTATTGQTQLKGGRVVGINPSPTSQGRVLAQIAFNLDAYGDRND